MKLSKALSARIKSLRERTGLSQQEIANRGDLSLSLVAKLEHGKKADPRASTLMALAGALGVRPGQLLDDLFPVESAAECPAARETLVPVELNGHDPERKEKKKKKKKRKDTE